MLPLKKPLHPLLLKVCARIHGGTCQACNNGEKKDFIVFLIAAVDCVLSIFFYMNNECSGVVPQLSMLFG